MGAFEEFINGLDFDLPEGDPPVKEADTKVVVKKDGTRKVFVQKIITEVWVYTDTDHKTFGTQTVQDLQVLGDMEYDVLMQQVSKKRQQRRRNK